MNARQAWRKHVTSLLDSALDRNDAVLEPVSAALATAIAGGRHVYAFGAGHSLSLVIEMYRRADSLKAVRSIWNPELTSQQDGEAADRLESTACHYATLTMAPTSTITGAALIPRRLGRRRGEACRRRTRTRGLGQRERSRGWGAASPAVLSVRPLQRPSIPDARSS